MKIRSCLIINELVEIPDFTGYYASKDGKIYSTLAKGCRDKYDLSKRVSPKELKYRKTKKGYCRVYMRRESTNKREDLYVHRIIASLFIPNPDNLEQVNHIDCVRDNNNVDNLEWVSQIENYKYALEVGSLKRDKLGRYSHK